MAAPPPLEQQNAENETTNEPQNAIIAVIGPTGSGKSTFIKHLALYPQIVDESHSASLRQSSSTPSLSSTRSILNE